MDPLVAPTATGVNVRLKVHAAPGGTTLLEQFELCRAKGPLTAVVVMYRSSLPPLDSWKLWAGLVVPTVSVGKVRAVTEGIAEGVSRISRTRLLLLSAI